MNPCENSDFDIRHEIERLHKDVRLGRFSGCRERSEECLKHCKDPGVDAVTHLRIHSLAWESYDAFGEYQKTVEKLDREEVAENCRKELERARGTRRHPDFISGTTLTAEAYDLWRQRVMIVMMRGFAEYRLQNLAEVDRWFETADRFVKSRLLKANYKCNGTLMRLRYFQGQLAHRRRQFPQSRRFYDESLKYCAKRLEDQIATDIDGTEQEFSRYCLSKLHLKLGELSFDWGRFSTARRHLRTSLILLTSTSDSFLRSRARLLLAVVERAEIRLDELGAELLTEFVKAKEGLDAHPVYSIEARLEEIVTAVYWLRENEIPSTVLWAQLGSILDCSKQMTRVIRDALRLKLGGTAFHARIARARILVRCKEEDPDRERRISDPDYFPNLALKAVTKAEARYPGHEIPATLLYEARYVEGLAHEAKRNWASAATAYETALGLGRDNIVARFSCLRRLASAYLRDGRFGEAQQRADECAYLEPQIQNERLRQDLEKLFHELHKKKELIFTYTPALTRAEARKRFDEFYLKQLAASIDVKQPNALAKPHNLRRLNKNREEPVSQKEIEELIREWDRRHRNRTE